MEVPSSASRETSRSRLCRGEDNLKLSIMSSTVNLEVGSTSPTLSCRITCPNLGPMAVEASAENTERNNVLQNKGEGMRA